MEDDEVQQVSDDTGTDTGYDYSTFGNEEPATVGQPVTPAGDNPKWAPFLADVPAPFHDKVKGHLKEWDRGIQEQFQQIQGEWAPFKHFRDQNITAEDLQNRYALAERLRTDSVGFYNELRETLVQQGRLPNDVPVPPVQEATSLDPDDPYSQRISELQARLDERDGAFASYFESQQQAEQMQRLVGEENVQIDKGFQNIESKTGPLSGPLRTQILKEAIFMGRDQDRMVSVEEAAVEVFKFMQNTRATASRAPRTIPTGGSIPQSSDIDPGEMTKDQSRAKAEEIRARFYGNG